MKPLTAFAESQEMPQGAQGAQGGMDRGTGGVS